MRKDTDINGNAVLGKYIVWHYRKYAIITDDDDQFELDCRHCSANNHRIDIPEGLYMHGGMCPDSDPKLNWVCCGQDGKNHVLLETDDELTKE